MTGNSEGCPNLLGDIGTNDTDNQQKRLMDMCWLAGILEGEGCFTIQKRANRQNISYSPLIQITNTNTRIIDKAQRIIKDLGLACYVYLQKQKEARICYRVVVLGIKRVKRLIDLIAPFIECRKDQLDCLKTFVEARLVKPRGAKFEDLELNAMNQLYKLNRPYLFSETTCSPLCSVT